MRRLLEDWAELEKAYFTRPGIFPILHTVVVRTTLLERHPWIAVTLLQAARASKRECYRRLQDPPRVSLAWFLPALEQQRLLGVDPWAYGFQPKRHVLDTVRTPFQQEPTTRELDVAVCSPGPPWTRTALRTLKRRRP